MSNITSNITEEAQLSTFDDFFYEYNVFNTKRNITKDHFSKVYFRLLEFVRSDHWATSIFANFSKSFELKIRNSYTTRLPLFEAATIDHFAASLVYYLIVIWALIGIIGVIGNVVVIVVLARNDNKLIYEVFCIGLAVTDLTFLTLAAPMTMMHYIVPDWMFGEIICRLVNYVVYATLFSSALMLLGLTCSRFLAVVHPWKNRKMNLFDAKLACFGAWLIGILSSIPVPFFYGIKYRPRAGNNATPHSACEDRFYEGTYRIYPIFTLTMTYIVPFSCILIMNSLIVAKLKKETRNRNVDLVKQNETRVENKRKLRSKVTKLVIIVTTLYCVCWLPTQFVNSWYNIARKSFPYTNAMLVFKFISQTLSYASCCINPIVYSVLSKSFKSAIIKQFPTLNRTLRQCQSPQANVFETECVSDCRIVNRSNGQIEDRVNVITRRNSVPESLLRQTSNHHVENSVNTFSSVNGRSPRQRNRSNSNFRSTLKTEALIEMNDKLTSSSIIKTPSLHSKRSHCRSSQSTHSIASGTSVKSFYNPSAGQSSVATLSLLSTEGISEEPDAAADLYVVVSAV